MASVTVSTIVNAPISQVWQSWDAFGDIDQFNPNLKRSFLLEGSSATGLGATRQCDMADGKNYIRERIVDYVPQRRLEIDFYELSMPLKSARATFNFHEKDATSTEVVMKMDFVPKFGPFGALMIPIMKPQFKKMLMAMLEGNAAYVERGQTNLQAA